MKNSNSFQKDDDKFNDSTQQLPKQWDYLSKRLAEVQKGLSILQKKYSKMDRKFSSYTNEVNEFNSELTEEILTMKANMLSRVDVKEDILQSVEAAEKQIKRTCTQILSNKLQNYAMSFHERSDSIQLKIKSIYDQTKIYVDRAVLELKDILKKYVKQQGELQRKIEKSSRQNSPSFMPKNSLNKSKSAKKLLFDASQKSDNSQNGVENTSGWLSKSRGNLSKDPAVTSNSNRVSYLREKLKQFEKINKKYETVPQKLQQKSEKDEIVKKMRNYRQYLEQSQSELEPSNILNSEDMTEYSAPKRSNYPLF